MFRTLTILVCLSAFSISAQAAPVNVSPDDCIKTGFTANCWTTSLNGGNDIDAFSQLTGLDQLYKADSFGGNDDSPLQAAPAAESGTLMDSYSTAFDFTPGGDYTGATITYGSGDSVDCSVACYLLVKDGATSPARYLFNLALSPFTWDGQMVLNLAGFWDGPGSISHVAIFGGMSPVPVPAAFWLFGTALIGFIGISRRTKV
jgi:hypothetical protein